MKIVIVGSINFSYEIKKTADELEKLGHVVEIPTYTKKILSGEVTLDDYVKTKEKEGDFGFREKANEDLIKKYHRSIQTSDAILVLNLDKKDIKNYIGGNSFLEMGFAYVMDKKIFLLNDIPDMLYTDEIKAMKPIILNGNLSKIK